MIHRPFDSIPGFGRGLSRRMPPHGLARGAALVSVFTMLMLIAGCINAPESFRDEPLSALEEQGLEIFQREPCYSACHVTTLAVAAADNPTAPPTPIAFSSTMETARTTAGSTLQ